MKKIITNRIFLVIITALICISGTIAATTMYQANQINYIPSNTTWAVNDVKDALDDLYEKTMTNKEYVYTISAIWCTQYATGDYITVEVKTEDGEKIYSKTRAFKNSSGYLMDSYSQVFKG